MQHCLKMNISAVTGGVEQAVQHCRHLPLQRMPRSPSAVKKYLQGVRPRVVLDHIMPFIALDDRQLAAGGHECQQIAADNNEACC